MADRFTIERGRWYAWTMYPGYADVPYHSPIFMWEVEPLGGRKLRLKFLNLAYAEGVQASELTLTALARKAEFLVGDLEYDERCAVVGKLSVAWMKQYFPALSARHLAGDDDLQADMNAAFMPVEATEPALQPLEMFLWDAMVTAIKEGDVQAVERLEATLTIAGYSVTNDERQMLLTASSTGEVVVRVPITELEAY